MAFYHQLLLKSEKSVDFCVSLLSSQIFELSKIFHLSLLYSYVDSHISLSIKKLILGFIFQISLILL